uniref:VWA domain-containing protein n=1 Tax=Thermodesulfovibrio aggregans TaxID=86166 RepID=A0A7C4EMF3_9BACT
MEEFVNELFKRARKNLLYPPILKVELSDIDISEIDFSGRHKIRIGKNAIKTLSKDALLGIFHHELNHWIKHPYDVKTIILENYYLGNIQNKTEIRNLYDDVVVNLDLLINKELFEITASYREIPPKGKADRLLRFFYKEVTGLNFGYFSVEPELKEKLKALLEIDFLNTTEESLKINIKKFASVMKDLVDEEVFIPFSIFSLKEMKPDEIRKALRTLAKEIDLSDYRAIVEAVFKEIKPGMTPGDKSLLKDFQKPDIKWYETRAFDYAVYIKSIFRDGSFYPNEIKDFDIEESMDLYNPVESYGKVIPGIAKKHSLEGFDGCGDTALPDAVIIIDSSGSMTHPDIKLSYAVLSAFCIARNYIENGSNVGVINFSDRNISILPMKDRQKIYETIKLYQGGGTTFHIDDFDNYLSKAGIKERKIADYIFITDAGIHNLEALLSYFSKIQGRVTILWIKTGQFKENFQSIKKSLKDTVTLIEVENEMDLPKIIVGKSFREYAESY